MIKTLWNSFLIAFSMFSKIPMPQADWKKENMKYMMCFFPFIGLVIAAFTYLVSFVGVKYDYSPLFVTSVLVLIPLIVTGGIHIDGLLDTSDAMSSWQERERRLQILKDSNAGAFAVITACTYFLLYFGAYSQIWKERNIVIIIGAGFVISRCLSGISVVTFPKATEKGTVAQFSKNSSDFAVRNVLIFYLILLFAFVLWIDLFKGSLTILVSMLIYLYYYKMAMKYFGGITGDLSGCFLCLCEIGITLSLAIFSGIGGI